MATLKTLEETLRLVEGGEPLLVAGDEQLLRRLPIGNWIGGTIPYFMAEEGGLVDRTRLFVTSLPPGSRVAAIRDYDPGQLPGLARDAAEAGVTFLILPAESGVHLAFAKDCATYEGLFDRPLVGWVSGVHLEDMGRIQPKVFNGTTGEGHPDRAVALHLALPPGRFARVEIVNLFRQGDGDVLTFPSTGFEARECLVNGQPRNFAEYLSEKGVDTKCPLVADYSGAAINVSFQSVDLVRKVVAFYAPVFEETEYRLAQPVPDYVAAFGREMAGRTVHPVFSCNCILNFLFAELEGKRTEGIDGPITFGEIAYMLLNQTLVYLTFEDM